MENIKDKIIASLDIFSKNEKKIATFIIENYDTISHYNGNSIAEKSGTSKTTLVRFTQKLGYKGFIELKRDINKEQLSPDYHDPYDTFSSTPDMEKLLENTKSDISDFEKSLSKSKIEKLIEYILNASTVYLIGFGSDSIVMKYLYNYLPLCGIKCIYIENQGIHLREHLIHIEADDLIIMSNFPNIEDDEYLISNYAKKIGAKLISITSSEIIAKYINPDLYILVKESSDTFYNSPILSILLCNIILSELRHISPEKIESNLKKYKTSLELMKHKDHI